MTMMLFAASAISIQNNHYYINHYISEYAL